MAGLYRVLDTPIKSGCSLLSPLRREGSAATQLLRMTQSVSDTRYRAALGLMSIQHGEVLAGAWNLHALESTVRFSVWDQSEPHVLLAGSGRLPSGSFYRSVMSISNSGQTMALERRVSIFNEADSAVIVASRSPTRFDFALSFFGGVSGFSSQQVDPLWTVPNNDSNLKLGRFDAEGDGDLDVVLGTVPVRALDFANGAEIWTGTTGRAKQFLYADMNGDRNDELIVISESAVDIYSGKPAALVGRWNGFALDASVGDRNADRQSELVIAPYAGGLLELDMSGAVARTIVKQTQFGVVEHVRPSAFGPAALLTVKGAECLGGVELLSLVTGQSTSGRQFTDSRYARALIADFGDDAGPRLVHLFRWPTTNGTPLQSGVRIVNVDSGKEELVTPTSWQSSHRYLVDVSVTSAASSAPRELWTTGNQFGLSGSPWIAVNSALNAEPLRRRHLTEMDTRSAKAIHLVPGLAGSPDQVLLVTVGGNSVDNSLRAHFIDPQTLQTVGAPLALGSDGNAATQLADTDGEGMLEIVVQTGNRVAVHNGSNGNLRWAIDLSVGSITPTAIVESASPPLLAYARGAELVLLRAADGAPFDSVVLPTNTVSLGAARTRSDSVVVMDQDRLYDYSISTRTLRRGPAVGRGALFNASYRRGSMVLAANEFGIHGVGELIPVIIFADSFEGTTK